MTPRKEEKEHCDSYVFPIYMNEYRPILYPDMSNDPQEGKKKNIVVRSLSLFHCERVLTNFFDQNTQ